MGAGIDMGLRSVKATRENGATRAERCAFLDYSVGEVLDELVREVLENSRDEFKRGGICLGEVEELDMYGNRFRVIAFKDVGVDLENAELQKDLSAASDSWERLLKAISLEKLVSDANLQIHDYVDVEEISWNKSYGPSVRLYVSEEVEGLLQKYGLTDETDIKVHEMEEALEGIIDSKARAILGKLNEVYEIVMSSALLRCLGKDALQTALVWGEQHG